LAAVAAAVEPAQIWTELMAAAAAVVVARLDKPEDLVHPAKDLTAVMLVVTPTHTAARVAVAQPQPVRSAMPEQETAAQAIPTSALCTQEAAAAVVVALVLEVVARAAVVLAVTT
jgi:hypothetical protein